MNEGLGENVPCCHNYMYIYIYIFFFKVFIFSVLHFFFFFLVIRHVHVENNIPYLGNRKNDSRMDE